MANITFDRMTKRYSESAVGVRELSLEIADGEFLVLVGPSGCGKTTALRCLAGLEDITEGRIIIGNRVVNDLPPKQRDIAMVFQSYALYPHMTVYDNLAFSIKMRKAPKSEIDTKVQEAARILDLTKYLDRKPGALSGGQRQRVALGRAIVRNPSAFLMDEPLSNLDAKLRVQTRAEIARIHQRLGTTIVYVTHDQVEAMTMGDRIAVMLDGVLQQVGSPRELYERPINRFVAGFIGSPSMNFLSGAVTTDGTTPVLHLDGLDIELRGRSADAARARRGGRLTIGIRPEHFSLEPAAAGESMHVPATVDVVEFLGNDELIHVTVAGMDVVAVVNASRALSVGDRVELMVSANLVYAFDPETDRSLLLGAAPGANGTTPARTESAPVSEPAAAPAIGPAEAGTPADAASTTGAVRVEPPETT